MNVPCTVSLPIFEGPLDLLLHLIKRSEVEITDIPIATITDQYLAMLDELPETFREAVWLRDVEEFSYAEIAEMLGIPLGTVMSRISRGRRTLFERLSATTPGARAEAAGRR